MDPSMSNDTKSSMVPVWETALIGSSAEMLSVTKAVWRLAQAQTDTLIMGEPGTGKSLAASLIHRLGPRKTRPYITLQAAALAADRFSRESLQREASGGVVFLKEIGDLPPEQQENLWALLEAKTGLGATGEVQILAATKQNLEAKSAAGKFHRKLWLRLSGSTLCLPPLRDHAEDIPALAWYFIQKFNALYGRKIQRVAPEVFPALQGASWSENVRELKIRLEAAVRNCSESVLELKNFSPGFTPPAALPLPGASLDQPYREAKEKLMLEFHRVYLGHHLNQHHWNRSRTARAIGIMREQLNALIRRYKLTRTQDQGGTGQA